LRQLRHFSTYFRQLFLRAKIALQPAQRQLQIAPQTPARFARLSESSDMRQLTSKLQLPGAVKRLVQMLHIRAFLQHLRKTVTGKDRTCFLVRQSLASREYA